MQETTAIFLGPTPTDGAERKTQFASDLPICKASEDRFERASFAIGIARRLAERRDPSSLVVSINGRWGDGKTSVLRLMETEFAKHPQVAVAKFNPWRFGSEDELLRAFFETLADALQRSLSTGWEKAGKALEDYAFLLSVVGGDDAAKGLGKRLSEQKLEGLRARVESFLDENKLRIVMMVDDIDRLDRREIQAMFKLVKLSAGFNNISYVLAFDDEVVASAIGEQYGDGDENAGRRFLEKIVQIPLHLPPADQIEVRRMAFDGVEAALQECGMSLTEDQVNAFIRHYVDGLEIGVISPRQARLYGNALLFALPLLKGEVNPVDQLLIEGIRVVHPDLYTAIRDNPDAFLSSSRDAERRDEADKRRLAELINTGLPNLDSENRERVRTSLVEVLFPRVGSMGYGSEWNEVWFREQRICSPEYFHRYFTYGVPRRDIADGIVDDFVAAAEAGRDAELESAWASVKARDAIPQFVQKLRFREDTMPVAAAARIASLIAKHGGEVPRQKSMLLSDWGPMQAAILVARLVRRQDAAARPAAARQAIQAASIAFAFECLRWIRTDTSVPDAEDKRLVSLETEDELGALLAQRIAQDVATQPIFTRFGSDTPRMLWLWNRHDHEAAAQHVRSTLEGSPGAAVDLLCTYLGTAWGMESGIPRAGDFSREAYDAVSALVPATLVLEKLRALCGSSLDDSSHFQARETPLKNRVANQFASIHKSAAQAPLADAGEVPNGKPEVAG